MVISWKDICKMLGISIIACCAVFVCTLFLNYKLDLPTIKDQITNEQSMALYEAQLTTGRFICLLAGLSLALTSVIMLFFFIKHYIDTHAKELGILKALGYSNLKIAIGFWRFGLCVFLGATVGFIGSHFLMPLFYEIQNKDGYLPDVTVHLHPVLAVYLVLIPTLIFSILSVLYGCRKVSLPVMGLLRGKQSGKVRRAKKETDLPFLAELRKSTLRSRRALVFFIWFAAFCYSDMIQMAFSMDELSSIMFSIMMFTIGIILASVTMLLAMSTVVRGNTKTLAMLRVFGYSYQDCCKAVLSGYRLPALLGFIIGTIYQDALIRFMIMGVFKDFKEVPEYHFNWTALMITLVSFVIFYEVSMAYYSRQIKKITVKEVMLET